MKMDGKDWFKWQVWGIFWGILELWKFFCIWILFFLFLDWIYSLILFKGMNINGCDNFEEYFKVWVILELWNFDGLKLFQIRV